MEDCEIARLIFDDAIYPRVRRDPERVDQLADLLRAQRPLPPVVVERETSLVLGGWHTVGAYEAIGATRVPVQFVDVSPSLRLIYAYNQDVTAAMPYRDVDVRKVARLEYERRRGNGDSIERLARDLGRPRSTVQRWLSDLVERDEQTQAQERAARIVAVHAFRAADLSLRQIAGFVGVDKKQVGTDAQVSITPHLQDSRIVSAAHSLIHLSLGLGASREQMEAARDWLLAQTQPELLITAAIAKYLGQVESDVVRAIEFLEHADTLAPVLDVTEKTQEHIKGILAALDRAVVHITSIQRKVRYE